MAGEVRMAKVGDLAMSISETHKMKEERLVFLNTSDILLGKILHHNYTPVKDWPGQAKKSIRRGDILFSEIRPANGRWAYVDEEVDDFVVSTKLMVIRSKTEEVMPRYLYQFLTSKETSGWLQHLAESRSGTFPQITFDQIAALEIPLPPLPEQCAIAHVLGTLDDLIELNRETNEILEEMARALFKSWFVDFDPVRAKLEGRPPAGMDAATAALFPDHFQDSELGQIPKGWEVKPLGAVLDTLETGRRPKGGVAGYSSGVPSVGAESINGIGVFDFSKTKFIPHEFYEKTKSGRVQNLDVLLYKDGGKPGEFRPRVGMFGYGFPFEEFCINEHVFRMRSDAVGQHYLYFAIADERILLDFANKGGKAAIPGINQTDVRSTLILRPPPSVLAEFEKQAKPVCQSIIENFAESRDLATLRDTLLPKLLSGEISAPSAEERIAAASARS